MKELATIDFSNKSEVMEFLTRLSELVKCTLGGFNLVYRAEAEFVSTKIFAFRFVSFLPKGFENFDVLPYKKLFSGKYSKKIVYIYKKMLIVFFEIESFRMPPTSEPSVGYEVIESQLKDINGDLDLLLKRISMDNK